MDCDALGTRGGVLVLQNIPQAAQAFQQIAVGVGQGLPVLAGGFVAPSGRPHRQSNAHQQIACQQHQCGQNMITGRKAGQAGHTEDRDTDRRNGVGIEHLQLLDVGGDQGDQVAPVTALQLGGGQAAECAEHLIPDEGQQLEGDIVVGGLLCVAQHAAQQGKDKDADKGRAHACQRAGQACRREQGKAAEDRDKGGAEMADDTHDNGCQHDGQHGPDQHDQPCGNGKRTAVFCVVHALTSPRSSSRFWALYRRLYTPCAASRSLCVPCSAMWPASST